MSISIFRPSDDLIRNTLRRLHLDKYSYPAITYTKNQSRPDGYNVDYSQAKLGRGKETFEKAKKALMNLEMLRLRWMWPITEKPGINPDGLISVVANVCGLYFVNMTRIVYIIDEHEPSARRFGFAYGTLEEHAMKGEERFLLKFDSGSEDVSYDIFAISRPNKVYTWCGYPYARYLQKSFARDSLSAMIRAMQ